MIKTLRLYNYRYYSRTYCSTSNVINWDYLCNPENLSNIVDNLTSRNLYIDLDVINQIKELQTCANDTARIKSLKEALLPVLQWFPNQTHPRVSKNKSEDPILVKKIGKKPEFTYFPANFESLTKRLNILRTKNLGHMSGNKSYYLKGDLALFEQALVRFTLAKLISKNYKLVSVPDIIPKSVIERCGMRTDNKHSQIYHIDNSWTDGMCLSGTSEMALASYLSSKTYDYKSLPLKLCAVSRCYRAEAKRNQREKGIFRVHEFTKVEMFGITANETGEESEGFLHEVLSIQEEIFTELGLYCKVFEMPPSDLGLPAYHKYDIEAWIPTQKQFGEISSASNCTDYQSRRLDIKYNSPSNHETKYCHTVNGTAAAIPRLLITLFENLQNLKGSVNVPKPLQVYLQKDVLKDKFKEEILNTKPM